MKAVKNTRSTLVLFCMVFALIEALESDNNNNRPEPSIKRTQNAKLFYSKECQDDINRYCLSLSKSLTELSDLAVLQCIHNKVPDLNLIDKECHHLLYEVKKNLTINLKLDNSALQICREDLAKIPDCQSVETEKSGHLLSCILDNKEKLVTNECRTFITNVAALVFGDYRLISGFITDCSNDIERFSCGRIEKDSETRPTQQGKTIECLTLKFNELAEQCRVQITRVVELQSDDFHLDRPLYFACRDDREKFCPNVRSGNGAVYKCLMRNKFNTLMSGDCQEQLTRRQKVIVEDAFADKTLVRACKQDIIDHACRAELRDESGKEKKLSNPLKLAGLILCLESAIRDGDRVSANCEEELIEHRKILMSDYQLNPGIVKKCSSAIADYCGNGLERGGKTLHCLMHYAKISKSQKSIKMPDECINELRTLIKVADASEDVRVDSDLQEACQSILTGTCRDVSPGKGRVVECLMNQLNKPEMNEDCEERLLEIQFFASRDWRLTPQLYRNCKDDAVKFCNAKKTWQDWSTDVDNGPLVLPCLYHHLSDDDDENDEDNNKSGNEGKVSKKCEEEIRKVMIIRAKSINLLPEVQEACYADLSRFCTDANVEQKGEEMRCLQVNLKTLEEDCQKAVSKYTERENKDVRLDQILMRACEPIMNSYCADKKDGKGDLLECLIKQKNNKDIDAKCRMGIEHHQLLNMQNVNFNYKFKRACRKEISDHCASSNSKIEVVRCLSDIMLNDTLLDRTHRLNDMCRSQLRFETLQLNEDIKLDKDLDEACKEDAARLCGEEKNGRGDVLECLRANQRDLNDRCKKKLLSRDRINLVDQKGDYKLLSKCRDAISQYCDAADENADLIGCLRKQLLRPNLELGCRKVVIDRIMEQNSDARLNPSLWSACHNDAKLGCQYEFTQAQESADSLNGRVIKCLKGLFVANRLSKQCEVEIDQVMREAALVDYRLDPLLVDGCLTEISELCSTEPNDKKEDCLRLQFQRGHIAKGSKCFEEVRRLIIEGAADVFTDHEMSEVCAYDLNRYCSEVPPGGSQQLKCLLGVSESKRPLSVKCSDILNSREQLWKAAKVSDSLSGFNDLARLINQSEHRSYLLVSLFFIIASVFVLGCFCRPVFRTRSDKMK